MKKNPIQNLFLKQGFRFARSVAISYQNIHQCWFGRTSPGCKKDMSKTLKMKRVIPTQWTHFVSIKGIFWRCNSVKFIILPINYINTHIIISLQYNQKIDGTVRTYWFIKFIFGPFANLPFGIGKPSIWSLRVHAHFVLTTRIWRDVRQMPLKWWVKQQSCWKEKQTWWSCRCGKKGFWTVFNPNEQWKKGRFVIGFIYIPL